MLFYLIVAMNIIHTYGQDEIEARVIKGNRTVIERYPYCAFLYVRVHNQNFICGASIINHRILLTAAHCFDGIVKSNRITAFIGHTDRREGTAVKVARVKKHRKYDTKKIAYDIALVGLAENIHLGETISKVAIVKRRPKVGVAIVAGWGLYNEDPVVQSYLLHKTTQKFWPRETCERVLRKIPIGTFCAGKKSAPSYPSLGDSGSPLVMNGFVQIGLVSFKRLHISRSLIIYTDVSFFYDWIKEAIKNIYCKTKG